MKTLVVVLGPTGTGKTDLAIELAKLWQTEIISADSRQIYKELKIGTAVPTEMQLATIKHHFIGHKSIHDYYNASLFECETIALLETLFAENDVVIMAGGSMLYIDAVCKGIDDLPAINMEIRQNLISQWQTEGIESLRFMLQRLDPEYYAQVDLKNPKRLLKALEICQMTGKPYSSFRTQTIKKRPFKIIKIGLNRNRSELFNLINQRVDNMVAAGLVDEARRFYEFKNSNSLNTVGYKELFDYFDAIHPLDKAIELIKRNSRRYARRQLTWFNRDNEIQWFNPNEFDAIVAYIKQIAFVA